jgi:hypothetical protein
VQINSPANGTTISGSESVLLKGTAENLNGVSLWIFVQSGGLYYVNNVAPIPIKNGQWQFKDPYVGSGGVGTYGINAVLASSSCVNSIQTAKPQPGGGIAFRTLPSGCNIGDTMQVNVAP